MGVGAGEHLRPGPAPPLPRGTSPTSTTPGHLGGGRAASGVRLTRARPAAFLHIQLLSMTPERTQNPPSPHSSLRLHPGPAPSPLAWTSAASSALVPALAPSPPEASTPRSSQRAHGST